MALIYHSKGKEHLDIFSISPDIHQSCNSIIFWGCFPWRIDYDGLILLFLTSKKYQGDLPLTR